MLPLIAIIGILSQVPYSVLINELPVIVPVLVDAIQLSSTKNDDNAEVLQWLSTYAIETIANLLIQSSQNKTSAGWATFEQHLPNIIAALLTKLSPPLNNSAKLRMLTLHTLGVIGKHINVAALTKTATNLQGQVTSLLQKLLDDKKRPVRQLAVKIRNQWYEVVASLLSEIILYRLALH
jgi:hypothetical protein